MPTHDGSETAGPRYFTNASIRGILHNRFYAGFVKHGKHYLPGEHEPLISDELFESVQLMLSKNSGRSATIGRRKTRTYLLKGLVRCADCGMNLWAQTYRNGRSYYREQRASRSHGECPARGGSVPCEVVDEQVGEIFSSIKLPPDWEERAIAKIQARDEVARIVEERERVKERLRRLGLAFVDGLYDEGEYRLQKQSLAAQLEAMVVPEIDTAIEAGRLIHNMPRLWSRATLEERHRMLVAILDGVYLDLKNLRGVSALRPKVPFDSLIVDGALAVTSVGEHGGAFCSIGAGD